MHYTFYEVKDIVRYVKEISYSWNTYTQCTWYALVHRCPSISVTVKIESSREQSNTEKGLFKSFGYRHRSTKVTLPFHVFTEAA